MSNTTDRDKQIFAQALEFSSAEARAGFLKGACGVDEKLRLHIESLLQAHEAAGGFLRDKTVAANAPTIRVEPASEEPEGTMIGRYKLLQKIGEGGMGIVYMAEQEEPVRRRVALKIIKLGMDTRQVIARFEAERQALAMMDHPNIARVLDGGATETGRPYFVMELVQGVPITEFCDKNKFSARERLKLFIPICQAIQSAHQKGVIHRDIKPSNVLVTLNHGEPVPKVIDFGIAKATNQKLTEKTLFTNYATMIGTPAYMSPEQAEMSSLDVDTRADVYSLGVLLYELLTGSTPFPEKRLRSLAYGEMQRVIMEEEPERPSTRLSTMDQQQKTAVIKNRSEQGESLRNLLKGDLDWIVMKCLEKDRQRRYETANGLAADLKRHLDNEPVIARPPTNLYRLQKLVRRNKLVVGAVGAVASILVLGLSVSIWLFIRESRAHDQAVAAEFEQSRLRQQAEASERNAQTAQANEAQQRQRAEAEERSAQRLLYCANMNLTQQAWDENNIGRLRELLAETATNTACGFEWYYWQRRLHHPQLQTLRGHSGRISSAVFSPDGQHIVTASWDHTAKVWEAADGKELLTLKGHNEPVSSAAFTPDGLRIITGSFDHTAKLWDAAGGKELHTFTGNDAGIRSIAVSFDGQRFVTGCDDGTARLWEVASGKMLLSLTNRSGAIFSVAFSPDGQRIVTGSWDGTANVWAADSGKRLFSLKGHRFNVSCVAFSPDGQRIVTGSADGSAKVWEAAAGKELLTFTEHSGAIWSVAFAPDGQRIVTGSADGSAKVWDTDHGKELLVFKGDSGEIWSVAFAPDGQRIVTGSSASTAKVWDAGSRAERLTLAGPPGITSVAFSPDGRRIATGTVDGSAKLWEAATGEQLLNFNGHSNMVNFVSFAPDGRRIVTCSDDGTAKVWQADGGKELLTLKGHAKSVGSVNFSPDGQRIVTGGGDGMVCVWETDSGKQLLAFKGHTNRVDSVTFFPDGHRILTGSNDGTAKVWDANNGKELLLLKAQSGLLLPVAISGDGRWIVTGGEGAQMWEAATGKEVLALKGQNGVVSVAFSPDGRRIVTGSVDETAKIWDAVSGKQVLTLKGHRGFVWSVAFSPDGQRIVTGSWDGTANVWEAATAQQVATWQKEER